MKIAIIGRTETLFESAKKISLSGHNVCLIITSRVAPEYKKNEVDFEDLARELNCPFVKGSNIVKFKKQILKEAPDLGISMNYTGIIPQEIIDLFPLGILNAHGGDLPKYRGNACQAWAILNGENEIGLCIHKMIGDELDSGDIIIRNYLSINLNTKITEVFSWMHEQIPSMFLSSIQQLIKDPNYILERQSVNIEDSLRCFPRKPEDGKIDWSNTSDEVLRLINASNKPFTGAFTNYKGKKIVIWDAVKAEDESNFLAVPGQITTLDSNFIEVACGKGKLRILKASEDKKEILISNLIKSSRDRFS